jgi:hypothetical protein
MGELSEPLEGFCVDLARTPNVKATSSALIRRLGVPAIPSADLARIAVPTTLI